MACGFPHEQFNEVDVPSWLAVESPRPADHKTHFVVQAAGDSMDGGPHPIRDQDLVMCRWASISDPTQVEGKPCLLSGTSGTGTIAMLKVPVRQGRTWVLRSLNPSYEDIPLDPGVTLRVVGQVVDVVKEQANLDGSRTLLDLCCGGGGQARRSAQTQRNQAGKGHQRGQSGHEDST